MPARIRRRCSVTCSLCSLEGAQPVWRRHRQIARNTSLARPRYMRVTDINRGIDLGVWFIARSLRVSSSHAPMMAIIDHVFIMFVY